MKLNARQVETAKPKDKPYKLADGGGMYLEVFPNGTKSWRMKYRIAGKEKRVVFGVYPTITLADARSKRDDAKKLLVNGVDPSAFKQESKHLWSPPFLQDCFSTNDGLLESIRRRL